VTASQASEGGAQGCAAVLHEALHAGGLARWRASTARWRSEVAATDHIPPKALRSVMVRASSSPCTTAGAANTTAQPTRVSASSNPCPMRA